MTFKTLADAINALLPEDQLKEAVVYPPPGCPNTDFVPVVHLDKSLTGTLVLLTGKTPLPSQ